jgi:hypothetical protein
MATRIADAEFVVRSLPPDENATELGETFDFRTR